MDCGGTDRVFGTDRVWSVVGPFFFGHESRRQTSADTTIPLFNLRTVSFRSSVHNDEVRRTGSPRLMVHPQTPAPPLAPPSLHPAPHTQDSAPCLPGGAETPLPPPPRARPPPARARARASAPLARGSGGEGVFGFGKERVGCSGDADRRPDSSAGPQSMPAGLTKACGHPFAYGQRPRSNLFVLPHTTSLVFSPSSRHISERKRNSASSARPPVHTCTHTEQIPPSPHTTAHTTAYTHIRTRARSLDSTC